MKKSLILTAALLCSAPAYAANPFTSDDGFFLRPYVGVDYDYFHYNGTGSSANNFNGGDVHLGLRVHRYFGLEASYYETQSKDVGSTSLRLKGATLDAMGYLPVADALDLIVTAGVARETTAGSGVASNWVNRGRFGGGAEYWLTQSVNVRALVRYQPSVTGGSSLLTPSLGLNYQF